jgi:uncharacterized protein (TIGR02646 family)
MCGMKIKAIRFSPYLSPSDLTILNNLKPWQKDYWDKDAFYNGTNYKDELDRVKRAVKVSLQSELGNECCYCGSELGITSDAELDHIAPKYKHPQFTFELKNLVPSCTKCNKSTRKGKRLTIKKEKFKYAKCKFKIYHPHFDRPEKHFEYLVNRDHVVVIRPLTRKARKTISFFKLNDPIMAKNRGQRYLYSLIKTPDKYQGFVDEITKNTYMRV